MKTEQQMRNRLNINKLPPPDLGWPDINVPPCKGGHGEFIRIGDCNRTNVVLIYRFGNQNLMADDSSVTYRRVYMSDMISHIPLSK